MRQKKKGWVEPFRVAISGVALTFRTQRHMRFHLYVVLAVLVLASLLNFGLREVLILLFTISLVLIAEMFNSAIEAVVDLVQPTYHPLAKTAKDISAGAVLITTVFALVVGGLLILGDSRWETIKTNLAASGFGPPFAFRLIIGILLLFIIVVVGKGIGKRGQVLRGGLVSGHAAFAFFFAMGIMALTDQWLVSALAVILAAIVAQSRWEAKIHSIFELTLGATAGTIVGLLLFVMLPK